MITRFHDGRCTRAAQALWSGWAWVLGALVQQGQMRLQFLDLARWPQTRLPPILSRGVAQVLAEAVAPQLAHLLEPPELAPDASALLWWMAERRRGAGERN